MAEQKLKFISKRSHRKHQVDIYSFSNNIQKYLEENNGTL